MWQTSNRRAQLPHGWNILRSRVLRRDKWVCQIGLPGCLTEATEVDHIERGSDHSLTNLRAACRSCHSRKSSAEGHSRRRELAARKRRPTERHPGAL